jgi:hemerythrin
MKTGIGNELHGMIINRLVSYTVTHFSDEESLMATYDYPETTIHKAEHYRFVKQVRELQKQHESGVAILSLEIMMFLKEWLMRHIQGDDKKYGVFLNKNGFAK